MIIEKDASLLLIEMALNVSNTICKIGAFIHEQYAQKRIKKEAIPMIIHQIVQQKKSIFQEQLLVLSSNELKIAKLLAKKGFIEEDNLNYRISNLLLGF